MTFDGIALPSRAGLNPRFLITFANAFPALRLRQRRGRPLSTNPVRNELRCFATR